MYKLLVVSPNFEGKPMVAQHRMVNTTIATEISAMHGLTLSTKTPGQWKSTGAHVHGPGCGHSH